MTELVYGADDKVHMGGGIPEEAQPWAAIAVSETLRQNVSNPLRVMPDEQLRHIAALVGLYATILPHYLAQWDLPHLAGPGFWPGTVLPAIRAELDRRQRPKRDWGAASPIARLKGLDIVEVASRFTELTGHGDRLKGRCPLHQERTASFYVYRDTQRWHCYGNVGPGATLSTYSNAWVTSGSFNDDDETNAGLGRRPRTAGWGKRRRRTLASTPPTP